MGRKNFWLNLSQHAAQLNGVHRLVQKPYQYQAYCRNRTQKCPLPSKKNPKIEFFFADNSPKKFGLW